ncbi:MAG: DNA polymerase domain-containing protein [Candidatus Aenigmatarchaeota archaeon]
MECAVQVLDVDYFLKDGKPIIRVFGKRQNGQALCGIVEGFKPYFYVEKSDAVHDKLEELRLEHEEVQRKLPFGYNPDTTPFYKVFVPNPQDVPRIRTTLERHGRCYEADILFKYRFMVDHGLKGMSWAKLEAEPIRTDVVKCPAIRVRGISVADGINDAPLRTLCLDIECLMSDLNRAPDPKQDPIIAIGLAFLPTYRGAQSLVLLSKPASADGVQCFRSEKEMLEGFLKIVDEFDPDIITGYNINGFDMPYLLERLKKFGLSVALGRCDKPAHCKTFGGSQETEATGRVVVDVYQLLRRDASIRLHRYNLDTAAQELLGESKVDIKHTEIPEVWARDVKKFIDYARKDAMIALRLLLERRMLDKFIEIAKIAGPLVQDCLRGQTTRIEVMILHEFKRRGILLPDKPSEAEMKRRLEERIKGGAVLEPKRGLHTDSVLVLDFQSLYPSIIKAHNVSIDSLLIDKNKDYALPAGVRCHTAPNGARFVDQSVYEGVFPAILKELLAARLEAKRAMKAAQGDERRALDARQLALKILANSFYGYCGYARARLFRSEIANAITAWGRDSIAKTKEYVEKTFGKEVLYSDTDSLFVKIDTTDLEQAQSIGQQIASSASAAIGLNLEFEKVYRSFLILTKKRYAGWKFERAHDGWHDSIDMRGIETVRRDWCPLVGELMTEVLSVLLKERDVRKATRRVQETIAQLSAGKIPLEKLTIVKGVTRSLDAYDGIQPHVELAKKMQRRDPATSPKVGDRVGYVIVRGNDLLSKRAEDPEYVRQNGLQLDVGYYTNSQILPPIERIFESLGVERSELVGAGKQVSILQLIGERHGLACETCGRVWRRPPLSGRCECGGTLK